MTELKWFYDSEVKLIGAMASDKMVVDAARISTLGDEAQEVEETEKDAGLINYLMRDKHGSPFEHNHFKFLVKTPLFVRSEFHRHRIGWSYNEESGRYTEYKPEFYLPNLQRKLVQTGKVGHYQFEEGTDEQYQLVINKLMTNSYNTWDNYEELLANGVAKELARAVLPVNKMTSFYATCNARSLMSFLTLRTENENATFVSHPIQEIQSVAGKIESAFAEYMPATYAAYNKNGRVAP